jgi:nucleotide-binding universal stress UspA family protein
MKTIAVPTDFSACSKNAFDYAVQILQTEGKGKIVLVHVYMPNIEAEYPNFVPPVADFIKEREDTLRDFKDGLLHQANEDELNQIEVEDQFIIGFPAEEIAEISKNYDLLVMGKTGSSNLMDKLFGSVATAVAGKSQCPVILVPEDGRFNGMENILFASNYESVKEDTLEKLALFNEAFRAKLHFVHIKENATDVFIKNEKLIFDEMIQRHKGKFAFQINEIEADSVVDGINQYSIDHDIDLVVMVNCKKPVWQQIFERSTTKSLAFEMRVPLMVYHL